MITAEEFLRDEYEQYEGNLEAIHLEGHHAQWMMIEFAKSHVEAALKEAIKQLPFDDRLNRDIFTVDKIINCYPLSNIK